MSLPTLRAWPISAIFFSWPDVMSWIKESASGITSKATRTFSTSLTILVTASTISSTASLASANSCSNAMRSDTGRVRT